MSDAPHEPECDGWQAFAVAMGSNLGDRAQLISSAAADIAALPLTHVSAVSTFFDTEPVGKMDQPRFLNAALIGLTTLTPHGLFAVLCDIELRHGRTRGSQEARWGPRTLDLDLLLHGTSIINSHILTVPHPRMLERTFVLIPLAQIAPAWLVPGADLTVAAAAARLHHNLSSFTTDA